MRILSAASGPLFYFHPHAGSPSKIALQACNLSQRVSRLCVIFVWFRLNNRLPPAETEGWATPDDGALIACFYCDASYRECHRGQVHFSGVISMKTLRAFIFGVLILTVALIPPVILILQRIG
jgi:hypothetical protein